MITAELEEYIEKELSRGVTKDDIKRTLLGAGWQASDIEKVLNPNVEDFSVDDSQPTVPSKDNHVIVGDGVNTDTSKKPNGIKKWLLAGLVFLLVLLISGGIGGYFYYYSPEQVMSRAIGNLAEVEAYEYRGSVALHIEFPQSATQGSGELGGILSLFLSDYSANFWGEVDNRDIMEPKITANVDLKMGGGSLGEAEIRTVGDIVYLNIKSVNPIFGVSFDSFLNKWIKIDPQALNEKYDLQMEEELANTNPISEDELQEFTDFLKENPPYANLQKVGEDEIEGVDTYHFTIAVDEENLQKVFEKAEELFGESYGFDQGPYQESVSSTEFSDIDLWVGKKDSQIYRVKFFVESHTESQDVQQDIPEVSVDFDLSLLNHNGDIMIEEPASSTDLDTFLEGAFPTPEGFPSETTPSGETELPSDELEIEDLLRAYLLNDGQSPPGVSGIEDENQE